MLPITRPSLGAEETQAVAEVLQSGWITTGPKVSALEQQLADYLTGNVTVRLFNSATSALEASLLACDVGSGDEVIIPAMSFVATANVVLRVGAKPVFVDVDVVSRNLNVTGVSAAVSPATKAIIPVHFAGLAVDMEPLYQLAKDQNVTIIEDAAQAIGSAYNGNKIGSSGNPVCFSFHPNKNMTTIEGGAIASNDPEFIKRIERIRFHGIDREKDGVMDVKAWGGKMNLPDVSAAIGSIQLTKLDGFNQKRQSLVERYLEKLPDSNLLIKPVLSNGHSWHMFCITLDHKNLHTTRAQIVQFYAQHDINVGIHYPAMHLFSLYRRFGYDNGDFPNAELIGDQTLTLPLFPAMTNDDVDKVCVITKSILAGDINV